MRERRGYSRERIHTLTGISEDFLYAVEKGSKGISSEKLYYLSKWLGVNIDYLISGEQNYERYGNIVHLLDTLNENELEHIENIVLTICEFHGFSQQKYVASAVF